MFGWQVKTALILVPMLAYGVLFLFLPFPVTERVASGVSTREMLSQALRPMFLLWAFCMLLTASTELAPQGMQSLVLEKTAGMNGTFVLIYTSFMMFVLRHFAGPIAHRLSPVGMLTGSALLSAVGLFALSFAYDFKSAIAAATIYGLGIVYFWPTMLGVTAERFPRGRGVPAGADGMHRQPRGRDGPADDGAGQRSDHVRRHPLRRPAADFGREARRGGGREGHRRGQGQAVPADQQKVVLDAQKEGAKWSFRYVSALPVLLVLLFGAIALSDRARGGYKPEVLIGKELAPAELASDY